MNRNIEIKARASDFARQMEKAGVIADSGSELIRQEDTFFKCPQGRLKLRKISDREGELIYYQRRDLRSAKECRYLIGRTHEPELFTRILAEVLGVLGVVRKERTVYLIGQTRMHFDEVEGLGRFIELEVVLKPGQEAADGEKVVRGLMRELLITENDLVKGAYMDLLTEAGAV
jgi:predicted adenylyl cyclase CyaB